ncbi:MAG: 16S rRNA (cytosine(1402)-N(4))-methyltransferase RsmH [Alphaproteobacteria bacterium]|nr:16S rRNA (cytosine(1402)-N(4))-methyltransferase RsmH [Alphaproteobacteria bacterium]
MTAYAHGAHRPVLVAEVVSLLAPRDGEIVVDATFGAGGYSRALLEAAGCTVWGIDRDPDVIDRAAALVAAWPGRLTVIEGRFGDMAELLADRGIAAVDAVALDLGVSSPQLDEAERGFSFGREGPLDMRMSRSGPSAADIVNTADEATLADILWRYGEERASHRIARAIVAARLRAPLRTTSELADIVRGVLGRPRGPKGMSATDPATRTFQALRIHVNDELGELGRGLAAAEALLRPGGRLAVVAFHSLEDRQVKDFLRERAGGEGSSRHLPPVAERAPSVRLLTRGTVRPGAAETAANPRARSARMRAAIRTAAPAWGAAA